MTHVSRVCCLGHLTPRPHLIEGQSARRRTHHLCIRLYCYTRLAPSRAIRWAFDGDPCPGRVCTVARPASWVVRIVVRVFLARRMIRPLRNGSDQFSVEGDEGADESSDGQRESRSDEQSGIGKETAECNLVFTLPSESRTARRTSTPSTSMLDNRPSCDFLTCDQSLHHHPLG
jgi:hypothetical protein